MSLKYAYMSLKYAYMSLKYAYMSLKYAYMSLKVFQILATCSVFCKNSTQIICCKNTDRKRVLNTIMSCILYIYKKNEVSVKNLLVFKSKFFKGTT